MGTVQKKKTVWFGMKVTPEEKEKIKHLAKSRGVSQKHAVLQLVDQALAKEEKQPKEGSFYEKFKDHIGTFEGPSVLSTNPEYLRGFGQ